MGSAAGCHSIHSHATEDSEVSSSENESSHNEGDGAEEDNNAEEDKGGIETTSDGQVVSDGEEGQEHPHTQDTWESAGSSMASSRTSMTYADSMPWG